MTLWTIAHWAPLSIRFSRQENWSELPFSPPGDLPDPGIKSTSLKFPGFACVFFTTRATWEAPGLAIMLIELILLFVILKGSNSVGIYIEILLVNTS